MTIKLNCTADGRFPADGIETLELGYVYRYEGGPSGFCEWVGSEYTPVTAVDHGVLDTFWTLYGRGGDGFAKALHDEGDPFKMLGVIGIILQAHPGYRTDLHDDDGYQGLINHIKLHLTEGEVA